MFFYGSFYLMQEQSPMDLRKTGSKSWEKKKVRTLFKKQILIVWRKEKKNLNNVDLFSQQQQICCCCSCFFFCLILFLILLIPLITSLFVNILYELKMFNELFEKCTKNMLKHLGASFHVHQLTFTVFFFFKDRKMIFLSQKCA